MSYKNIWLEIRENKSTDRCSYSYQNKQHIQKIGFKIFDWTIKTSLTPNAIEVIPVTLSHISFASTHFLCVHSSTAGHFLEVPG